MSGAGQNGASGASAQAARSSNLQLDATVRALEHSHLTSRPLSLEDFVLTAAPSSVGQDVVLLHAKCTRAGLPQSDKTYLLKVFPCSAFHAYENELEVAASLPAHPYVSHTWTAFKACPPHHHDGALGDMGDAIVVVQDSHPANLAQLEAEPSACSLPVFMRTGLCLLEALSFLKAQGVSHPYLQASHVGITQHGHPVLQNMVGALSCRIASKGDGTASLTAPVQDIVAAAAAAVGSEIPTSAAELPHFPALCMLSPEALAVVLSAQGAPLSTEQADLSSQASFLAGQLLYRIITGRPPLAEYPWRYVRSEGGSTSITYEAAWMAPLPAHVPPALAQTVTALLAPLPSQRLPIEVAVRSFAQMGAAGIGVPPPLPLVARLLLLTVQPTSTPLEDIVSSAMHPSGQADAVPGLPAVRVPVPVWPSDSVGAVVHRAVHLVGYTMGPSRPRVRLVVPSAPKTSLYATLASVADVVFSRPHCFVGPGSVAAAAESSKLRGDAHTALHSVGVVYVTSPLFTQAASAATAGQAARTESWGGSHDDARHAAGRTATSGTASPALSQLSGNVRGSPSAFGATSTGLAGAAADLAPATAGFTAGLQLPAAAPPGVTGLQVGGGSGLGGGMGMDFNLGGGFDMFGGFGGGFSASLLGDSAGVSDAPGSAPDAAHDSAMARSALGSILDDDDTDQPPALPLDLNVGPSAEHTADGEAQTGGTSTQVASSDEYSSYANSAQPPAATATSASTPSSALPTHAPTNGNSDAQATPPAANGASRDHDEDAPTPAAAEETVANTTATTSAAGAPAKPATGGWASIAKRAAERPVPEPRTSPAALRGGGSSRSLDRSATTSPVLGAAAVNAAVAAGLAANPLGADLSWRTLTDEDLAYEIERRCGIALAGAGAASKSAIRLGNLRDGLRDMQDRTHTRDEAALLQFASQGYIEASLAALELGRAKDPSTASYALQTVSNLAMQAEVRQLAADKGVIEAILGAMKAYPAVGRVLKDAVVALRHMAYENDDNKVRMATSGAVAQVIASMQLCQDSPQVQRQCCGALSIFAVHSSKGDIAKQTIVASGGVTAILSAIQHHMADVGVCVAALKALGTLVHMPAARQAAIDAGAEAVCAKVKEAAEARNSKQLLDVLRQTERRLGQGSSGASSTGGSGAASGASSVADGPSSKR